MKTILKIKWEIPIAIIMIALMISLIIVTANYFVNDWKSWVIVAFTAIGIFVAYYGIQKARRMLLEVYYTKK